MNVLKVLNRTEMPAALTTVHIQMHTHTNTKHKANEQIFISITRR